jgi:hypothetical protein
VQPRRFKKFKSLEARLIEDAKRWREEARLLLPGAAREALLRKAKQAETAAQVSEWLRAPGLQTPRKSTLQRMRPFQP